MKREISLSDEDFFAALSGDLKSARRLLAMARSLCSAVEDFRVKQPVLARKIARTLSDWPAVVGRHKASLEQISPILEELELAEDHPARSVLAPIGKGPNLGGEINAVALDIWEWMNLFRGPRFSDEPDAILFRALPEFSGNAFGKWWKLGWPYFVKSVGGDPFNDRRLATVRTRIEGTAKSQAVSVASRVATEVRKAAKELWPQLAGLSDEIDP